MPQICTKGVITSLAGVFDKSKTFRIIDCSLASIEFDSIAPLNTNFNSFSLTNGSALVCIRNK
jgi:hypothetical protein